MTGKELTDEELQEIADTYGLYTEQDVENRVSCELLRIGARNEDLEKENAELKEQIEALANVNIKAQNIIGEAKKIIKLLLDDLRNRSYEPVKDVERAEQFLKENK